MYDFKLSSNQKKSQTCMVHENTVQASFPSIVTFIEARVGNIRIFFRIFFFENYLTFEYFLTEYSNNE
jgi:hypothetical protein